MQCNIDILDIEQGSNEWLQLRKTKITATDAPVIMGVSKWKTKIQLYNEKIQENTFSYVNDYMKRGSDLEPIARDLFCINTGIDMKPAVVLKDWAMASLDGINDDGEILEIKCPGEHDHSIAVSGKVPDHYYPQIQHQLYVCNSPKAYYFSFDGLAGVIVEVLRDDEYISKMLEEEEKFYQCLVNRTQPEPSENDYTQRSDDVWTECASRWKSVTEHIKELQEEEEDLRRQLIFLSGESNTKGGGISLCQVTRKGNINYSKIECLKSMDLEPYRNPPSSSWRICREK